MAAPWHPGSFPVHCCWSSPSYDLAGFVDLQEIGLVDHVLRPCELCQPFAQTG